MRRYFGQILFFILLVFCALSYPQSVNTKNLLDTYKDFYVWQEPKSNLPVSDSVLTVLGRWAWGPCQAVDADSNFAYIGNGPTFHILDISNPADPEIYGEYLTDGYVYDIELKDSYAFACIGRGLLILDISDPSSPEKISFVGISGIAISLALFDTFAYVTTFSGAMWVVDISDLHNPFKRGGIAAGGQLAYCVEAKDRYVYVGNPEVPLMVIIDANNPDSLSRVDFNVGGRGLSAFIKDSLLFIGVGNDLKIYDVSNASSPEFVGQVEIETSVNINGITVSEDGLTAYVLTQSEGIYSVDITDLTQPVILDKFEKKSPIDSGNAGIALSQNTLVATYFSGLLALSVSEPDSLKLKSFFPTAMGATGIDYKESLVIVACGLSGIWILDFSDPAKIENIANVFTGGPSVNIIVDEDYAYVFNWNLYSQEEDDSLRGLWIIDIRNPYQPKVLTHYIGSTSLSAPHSITKSNNFLFITQTSGSGSDTVMEIIDVNDILNPKQIGTLTGNYQIYNMAVEDSILYLATFDSGLRIINISNPNNPVEISNILNSASGVALNKPYVYTSTSVFTAIDVADPINPFVVSSIFTHYGASRVDLIVHGDYSYWADGKLGVIDISNPESPVQITTFNALDHGFAVAADSEKIYFTDLGQGVWILKNNLITSVEEQDPDIFPNKFELKQNYPNPFNPKTTIEFFIPRKRRTVIKVFDLLGQIVYTLIDKEMEAGNHKIKFDASNLPSGIYFYQLKAGSFVQTKKMILLR